MFHVVEFVDSCEVAVIPSNWFTSTDTCVWPPIKAPSKLNNMIKNKTEPLANWQEYKIRSMREFPTYEAARSRLKLAEIESDIMSDEATARKRKRNQFLSDSESSSEESQSLLPEAPRVPELVNTSIHIPEPNTHFANSSPSTSYMQTHTSNAPTQYQHNRPEKCNSNIFRNSLDTQFLEQTPQVAYNTNYSLNTQMQSVNSACCNCSCHKLNLQILKNIEKTLKAHTELLNLHTKMLLQSQNKSQVQCASILPRNFPIPLPLNKIEDLSSLESYLSDDSNFSEMLSYFSSFGGDGLKNAVHRLLPVIISWELALQLNWKGRCGKHGFQQYKRIFGIIYQAVKSNMTEVKMDAVEKMIKDWLRYAPDRCGKRKDRKRIVNVVQ